ncbi:MipA/OmpV family protein [Vreelandella andesensis]|uniref:MipA/OmpV family protein n=1 Tax=Vreelandella andesensis TaxID=447567 RepID=A0A433KWJ9_9GAMM|nr:MipA/OmpV family protein [Halomonas andesensis]RUR34090.1 MipA/OmpV family protein [Halomonas andesensis]
MPPTNLVQQCTAYKPSAYQYQPSRRLTPLLAAAFSIVISAPAWGDSWEGSVGAGVTYAPDYLGSNDYETRPLPVVNLTYGDQLSINLRNGIEWHAIRNGNWTASPFIGYTFGRDNKGDISQFEEVDGGATLGLRVSYQQGFWRYSVAGSTPVSGDVEGAKFSANAALRMPVSERTLFTITPSVTYSNEKWTESLFAVSTQDSLRSGMAAYTPDGGYWRMGVNTSLSYALTPEWTATGFVGAAYLTGSAADSPIVDELGSDWQALTGVTLSYRF